MESTVADICAVPAVVEVNSDLVLSLLLKVTCRTTKAQIEEDGWMKARLTSTTAFSYGKGSVSVISQYSPTTHL